VRAVLILGVPALVGILLLLGLLYRQDNRSADRALQVESFLAGFCQERNRFPTKAEFFDRFAALANTQWFYWPDETLQRATFQYPMTLPLPDAPGRSKLSEFFPVIYAYAVAGSCNARAAQPLPSVRPKTPREWFDPPLDASWTLGPPLVKTIGKDWAIRASAVFVGDRSGQHEEKRAVFLVYTPLDAIYRALDRGPESMSGCDPASIEVDLPRITYRRSRADGTPCTTHVYHASLPDRERMRPFVCERDPACLRHVGQETGEGTHL
jgi:hypothetical protein